MWDICACIYSFLFLFNKYLLETLLGARLWDRQTLSPWNFWSDPSSLPCSCPGNFEQVTLSLQVRTCSFVRWHRAQKLRGLQRAESAQSLCLAQEPLSGFQSWRSARSLAYVNICWRIQYWQVPRPREVWSLDLTENSSILRNKRGSSSSPIFYHCHLIHLLDSYINVLL